MTDGHKHRTLRVRRDSRLCRVLTKPRLVLSDRHAAYVNRSRFAFGVRVSKADHHEEFPLTLLGVLHGLTGLTLEVHDG